MFFIPTSKMLEKSRIPYLFIVLEIQIYPTSILSQTEFLRITVVCFWLNYIAILVHSWFAVFCQFYHFSSICCCIYLTSTNRVNFRFYWVCDMLFQHQLLLAPLTLYYSEIAVSVWTTIFCPFMNLKGSKYKATFLEICILK